VVSTLTSDISPFAPYLLISCLRLFSYCLQVIAHDPTRKQSMLPTDAVVNRESREEKRLVGGEKGGCAKCVMYL
jgi:hypothetical protein